MFFPSALNTFIFYLSSDLYKPIYYILTIAVGYFVRKRPLIEMLAFYCAFMLLFSCSLFTHYMVIPMLFFAFFENRFWIWYNIVGLIFFIFQHDQFNMVARIQEKHERTALFMEAYMYYVLTFILFLAIIDVSRPGLLGKRLLKRIARFQL